MKRAGWSAVCLCCVLLLIYTIKSMYPGLSVGADMEISRPTVFFVDESISVGEPLQVAVLGYPFGTEITYEWSVDGQIIHQEGDTYIPTEADLQKFIRVVVMSDVPGYEVQTCSLLFSKLPVFYLQTDDGQPIVSKTEYKTGDLRVQGNSIYSQPEVLYDGRILIKGRGNSTWNNSDKKPYYLKLETDANLLGLGEEKDWILLANAFDQSLMRNMTAYELSGKMGLTYVQSTWVDMVINDEYVGNYQICEKVEISEERVDITDWETLATDAAKLMTEAGVFPESRMEEVKQCLKSDLSWLSTREMIFEDVAYTVPHYVEIPNRTGGVLVELDMYWDAISRFRVGNQHFGYNEPTHAESNKELNTYMDEYMTAFYDAAYAKRSGDHLVEYCGEVWHYSDFFDVDSLVAYYLIQEIYFNADGTAMSTFFYKDVDEIAYMGPVWDMDRSSGGRGDESYRYDQWQTEFYSNYDQADQWYKGLVEDPYFLSKVKECWDTYHEDIFALVETDGVIDQVNAYICESGVADSMLWNGTNYYDDGVAVFKTWMTNHLNWMEERFITLETLVESIGRFSYGVPSEMKRMDDLVEVHCGSEGAVKAVFYLNGQLQQECVLEEGNASWNIPQGGMLQDADVIQVRIYDGNGIQIASNYMDNR